ncbi:nuclear transport factor 2-like [Protopterus annectens]|uniref:nuclear transport factor 2-like n=1 Tax=Protopterus annectens TaxID=7888 RepID=UPI001CF97E65|nr:nuclear transport factor 2-like [Protopterus annectens]
MDAVPVWEQIGSGFVQIYYQHFDTNRLQLRDLYTLQSTLTWEGQIFQGRDAIMEKLAALPFQKIRHSITSQDHQPTPDSCVLTMVTGQLQADDDKVMGFNQTFILKNMEGKWVCINELFRLALHNFG